jgi:ADP-heptose:LPS heptosyltransferase
MKESKVEAREEVIVDGFQDEVPIFEKTNGVPLGNKRYVTKSDITVQELMGGPKPNDDVAFVIIQDGGVGDAICATPMIKAAKKFYKDKTIIVGSSHAEILENNPDIDHLYHLASPGDLFEKWVKPLKHFGSVVKRDIYNSCAHKIFPGPLSMIWCHLYGLPFEDDDIKVYLTEREDEEAKKFLKTFPRPVILIHGTGAKLTFNPSVQITPNKDWFFDYWQVLVNNLVKDFDIIQVGGKEEPMIPGVTTYLMGATSLRQTAALLKNCLTYVSIDSFVGHCGAGVGKTGIVLFGRSNPYIAGHKTNLNLWVKDSCEFNDLHCGRPQGYFGDSEMFRGQMRPWACPSRSCMRALTPDVVIQEVYKIVEGNRNLQEEEIDG